MDRVLAAIRAAVLDAMREPGELADGYIGEAVRLHGAHSGVPEALLPAMESLASALVAGRLNEFDSLPSGGPSDRPHVRRAEGAKGKDGSGQEARRKAAVRGIGLQAERERTRALRAMQRLDHYDEVIGQSQAIIEVIEQVEQVKDTAKTVLFTGETGTGKDLLARVTHNHSVRRDKPFVVADMAGFPADLVQSELFGHEEGAFTGAGKAKQGKFELAHGGTVFLDEVGDLDETCQKRLLRVLENGEFERLGGTRTIRVDARVIAATSLALEKAVEAGAFRLDLFYRVHTFPIRVPPLRERPEDIRLLAYHFCQEAGRPEAPFTDDAMSKLLLHEWPGNVRELKSCVERALLSARVDAIRATDIEFASLALERRALGCDESDRVSIIQALREHGSVKDALTSLGMPKSTFYDKAKRYGLRPGKLVRRGR